MSLVTQKISHKRLIRLLVRLGYRPKEHRQGHVRLEYEGKDGPVSITMPYAGPVGPATLERALSAVSRQSGVDKGQLANMLKDM